MQRSIMSLQPLSQDGEVVKELGAIYAQPSYCGSIIHNGVGERHRAKAGANVRVRNFRVKLVQKRPKIPKTHPGDSKALC